MQGKYPAGLCLKLSPVYKHQPVMDVPFVISVNLCNNLERLVVLSYPGLMFKIFNTVAWALGWRLAPAPGGGSG